VGEAHLTKAERLLALYWLDRENLLEGLTLQQLADVFSVKHRSTIMRSLESLKQFNADYSGIRDKILKLHEEQKWDRRSGA